ncbi:MAG: DUF3450 family protein, partial [Elusimicrobia bacterium]|nr:DUF3450 family protein [Elusimicrobiota bacterium]
RYCKKGGVNPAPACRGGTACIFCLMQKMGLRMLLIGEFMFLLLFPAISVANEKKFSEKIEKTEKLLKEEQAQHKKEKEQAALAMKSLTDRIKTLEEKIDETKKDIEKLKKQIEKSALAKKHLNRKKSKTDFFLLQTRKILFDAAQNLKNVLISAYPDYDEKIKRLDDFEKRTKDEHQDLGELFQELYHYYCQEIERGHTSEVYSDEVETAKGEIKKAKFLRVGEIILSYKTNDDEDFGLWDGNRWETNLSGRVKKSIRKAIEIMEGKKIPQLLDFPVVLKRERK